MLHLDNGLDNELNGFESKRILKLAQNRCYTNGLGRDVKVQPQALLASFGWKSWVLLPMQGFLRDQWTNRLNTQFKYLVTSSVWMTFLTLLSCHLRPGKRSKMLTVPRLTSRE